MNQILTVPIDQSKTWNDQENLEYLNKILAKLVKDGGLIGDPANFLVDYEFHKDTGVMTALVTEECIHDPSKFGVYGVGLGLRSDLINSTQKEFSDSESDKLFSAQTIAEKLKMARMPIKTRARQLLLDFKKYFNQNKNKLKKDEESYKNFRTLFVNEMTALINAVLPQLIAGKNLGMLLGTDFIPQKLSEEARNLSLFYKRALAQEEGTGYVQRNNYEKLKSSYTLYLNDLFNHYFQLKETKFK